MSAEGSPEEYVEGKIKDHRIIVFAKKECPFCQQANNALIARGAKKVPGFKVDYINELGEGFMGQVQDYIEGKTGSRTVPKVFFDGVFVGNADKVQEMYEDGSLKKGITVMKAGETYSG
uniref:Glutaredoxin-1 n=1 Tax=Chromera velia CCMP2878 TaxID=1169474 RepID=A0A0G4HHF9_9ALVE|eukprot:Cvel_27480.t1-p1 / transcript=Cvel_27480.t1 / gene=Cvel_27480 / organism=Chromera_velia_CCMP2878 / gene_product=Glutaredoxin-C8, putative / transcript_product=Glutaredoxin-C8, putative / location=Cvel_scaffold3434:12600-14447(+) / protein_length=118 / sequence_SO=supercontig / SO=protein_coding / is_pseudo=false